MSTEITRTAQRGFDVSDIAVPNPCTTREDLLDANPGIRENVPEIDTRLFATVTDRIILECIKTHQLIVDELHGKIYNRKGYELRPAVKNHGYLYISIKMPNGKSFSLPVHRIVYLKAHPEVVLGSEFDIHHEDKNPQNNSIFNLRAVPRRLHTVNGAFANVYEAEDAYIKIINRRKHGACLDKDLVKALRVCAAELPKKSMKRTPVYDYFAEKMHISRNYVKHLVSGGMGKSILPATEEERTKILSTAEYKKLLNRAGAVPKQEGK